MRSGFWNFAPCEIEYTDEQITIPNNFSITMYMKYEGNDDQYSTHDINYLFTRMRDDYTDSWGIVLGIVRHDDEDKYHYQFSIRTAPNEFISLDAHK